MPSRITSWLARPSIIGSLVSLCRLSVRLIREPRVPLLLKALPVGAVLYVVDPLDIVPDVLPLLGQVDDIGILLLALSSFVSWCPGPAVDFHRAGIAARRGYTPMPATGDVIDAEFRRED